ncbi:MarR family transcriptional regulator [Kibdelosporangium philippinense]|uniref:MarR family transcriptional regulator n=1 Tax=Kibdelosporangium philippinense TaxID=211113 RepID=A0ABS8ZQT7_9PSEU|nr:MarR family transcriptional regulator [Kibdelosporangium philippinense]MCE7010085.1 MarR family transcriptional regulator [Kibdelosporangium philippinense]
MFSKTRNRAPRSTDTRKPGTAGIVWSAGQPAGEPETTTITRTDAEDKLWRTLHASPTSTAADLAAAAKIGKSTAQKILARWIADHLVTRTTGIAEGTRRAADLWAIDESTTAQQAPAPSDTSLARDTKPTVTAHAEPDTDAAPTTAVSETSSAADVTPTEGDATSPTGTDPTDIEHPDATETDASTVDSQEAIATDTAPQISTVPLVVGPSGPIDQEATTGAAATEPEHRAGAAAKTPSRLAPGALCGMVEDYLRDHPSEEFGPVAVANGLGGKSSGAVSNALDKLVRVGIAVKTKDKPRRFMLSPAEATAPTSPSC